MGVIWTGLVLVSLCFAVPLGRGAEVGAAALGGAGEAIELLLALAGPILLWSALMELLRQCGWLEKLSRLLSPLLLRLFPSARENKALREALSCNVSANLLGLGNAATPAGIRAARELRRLRGGEEAGGELCRLVVMNTASIQLIPTTVAALRAAAGASAPFDILPAVWLASLISLCVGLLAEKWFSRLWRGS